MQNTLPYFRRSFVTTQLHGPFALLLDKTSGDPQTRPEVMETGGKNGEKRLFISLFPAQHLSESLTLQKGGLSFYIYDPVWAQSTAELCLSCNQALSLLSA